MDSWDDLLGRARLLEENGQLDEAVSTYNLATRLYPHNEFAYFFRALVYFQLGDYRRTIDDINQALSIFDPKRGAKESVSFGVQLDFVYFMRGRAHLEMKKFREATTDFELALSERPDMYEQIQPFIDQARRKM